MSWHFFQEEAGAFSLVNYLDGIRSVRSRSGAMQETSSCKGNETGCLIPSLSGMMLAPSTEALGGDQLTLSLAAFPAKTSAALGKDRESPASVADFGRNTKELLAKLGLDLSTRKTARYCGRVDSASLSKTLPSWGMTADGGCWELGISVKITGGTECGYLPTPTGVNGGRNHIAGRMDEWGGSSNPFRKTPIGKVHCPRFEEWMMGWPETWGALTGFEMDKYLSWLQTHSQFYQETCEKGDPKCR